ncbi:serum amyloid A-1 protein isoform X2 [Heterocephalus glaber]|uniref:Serum amyloid A protein n=1 Tax=Heterocephalus glaber TaxID=10181 RepID=A0AAX6PH34_HETGA|nr:serum amyloid A-1 protein isoform X2 [Heterocephalus glaber]
MRLCIGIVLCSLVLGVSSDGWYSFFKEAAQGSWDMWRAYWNLQVASYPNSERYFHARGNYDAAQRGPGGVWAAKVLRLPGLGWSAEPEQDLQGHVFSHPQRKTMPGSTFRASQTGFIME